MKIGIVGAGFTGLSAGFYLQKKGYKVSIFEKEENPGGLALGFKHKNWDWTLEKHYHHFFTNDNSIINLAKKVNHEVIIKRPKTSVYVENDIFQLDSPLKVLTFPKLSILDKLRMAFTLGILRYNPVWLPLERIKAVNFLPKIMGKKAYKMIWEPQLIGKFGNSANEISLAWFWARIKKRTTQLAYPKGGFLELANAITSKIIENKGNIFFNTEIQKIENKEGKVILTTKNKKGKEEKHIFDKVIVTLPSQLFLKVTPDLPNTYKKDVEKLKSIGAMNLVLRLKEHFFKDDTYWLSICDKDSQIIAIVEHTNFMDKKNYSNEHLIYLGKYLDRNHPYFFMTKEELLKTYDPFLKRINKNYKKYLIDYYLFKDPFAQPIIPTNYSKILPPFKTPLKNVYLANIDQVYPWDRGTNYAVELGEKIAEIITK